MTAIQEELVDICERLRAAVLPYLGTHVTRGHSGSAAGGDVTFDIDACAELTLAEHMAASLPRWAYYSEDRGLQGAAHPVLVLSVEPIDGTRPEAAGLWRGIVAYRPRESA